MDAGKVPWMLSAFKNPIQWWCRSPPSHVQVLSIWKFMFWLNWWPSSLYNIYWALTSVLLHDKYALVEVIIKTFYLTQDTVTFSNLKKSWRKGSNNLWNSKLKRTEQFPAMSKHHSRCVHEWRPQFKQALRFYSLVDTQTTIFGQTMKFNFFSHVGYTNLSNQWQAAMSSSMTPFLSLHGELFT